MDSTPPRSEEAEPAEVSTPAKLESPNKTLSGTSDQKHHNQLLDKYISVWLWSALFGASTGLVVTLITYRTDARWGLLNALLLFILLISVVAAVVSWRALLRYMTVYLIPKFLLHKFETEPEKEKEAEKNAAKELRRAFEYLVIAAATRVVVTLLEMAYASFGKIGF